MKYLMRAAKNLACKCTDFCAKVFGSQQGGITKTGMDAPIMGSRYVTYVGEKKIEVGDRITAILHFKMENGQELAKRYLNGESYESLKGEIKMSSTFEQL